MSTGAPKVREGEITSLALLSSVLGTKARVFVCRTSALLLSYALKVRDCPQGQNTVVKELE